MSQQTIRPSRSAYKKAIGANAAIFLPFVAISVFNNRDNPVLLASVLLATLAVVSVFIVLYFRNTRIDFGDGAITRVNLFGSTRRWATSDVGDVVLAPSVTAPAQPPTHYTMVLDRSGNTILRPTSATWSPEQIQSLVEGIGVEPTIIAESITPGILRDRYPNAIAWWEAHPLASAFILVGVICVAIVAFVLAFM